MHPNGHACSTKETSSTEDRTAPPALIREEEIRECVARLIRLLGDDPSRQGVHETPKRVAEAFNEWFGGYAVKDVGSILKCFEDGAEKYDELVMETHIPVWSHCEHHMAPFFGVAHIGYIPKGKVVGLSKLSRLVEVYARRLQVQERLTQQIAHAMKEHLDPIGVGVVLQCRHTCIESRGVNKAGVLTTTSCLLGALREGPVRSEFLSLIPALSSL